MENKNKRVRAEFSTILLSVIAILLFTAPSVGEDIDYDVPGGFLDVYGTVNLLPGANVDFGVTVYPNGFLNIHAGTVGYLGITVLTPTPEFPGNDPVVTVYGTNFQVDGGDVIQTPASVNIGYGTLKGNYADGTDINLLFMSDIPIHLEAPGGEPLEAQLWVFPSLINRYGPLSKILAMVRLPEGITKDKINSE